jgi:hypothetical protein
MKLIKQSKLLTFQIIVCLIILNTQVSFAQSKFDGSYIGAKLGSAKGSADSNEVAGATYNGGINVGQYSPNGNIFGIYGGYNTSFNKEYFLGFEAGLNRLEIKTDKQLALFVGDETRIDDSIAMTDSGYYFSPEVKVGVLLSENSNYYIKAGKVFSNIKQSYRDNNARGTRLTPQAETSNLNGNSIGLGFEYLDKDTIYKVDFSSINFGTRTMRTSVNNSTTSFSSFTDKLSLNIFSIGFAKKF